MKILTFFLISCFLFWSCDTERKDQPTEITSEEAATDQPFELVDIQHEGFQFTLAIPNDYYAAEEFSVEMNESFGQLEISSGRVFRVEVIEDKFQREELKAALERDQVFEFEIVEDVPHGLLYRQNLPGGGKTFWHLAVTLRNGDRTYVVSDAEMSELNEYQSHKIFDALVFAAEHQNKSNS